MGVHERVIAKALFAFTGGFRAYELTFHPNTKLVITIDDEEANQGWVFGHYLEVPDLDGWFPKTYVEIIQNGKSPKPLGALVEEYDDDQIQKMKTDDSFGTQLSFGIA